jgi:hypothetical protein
LRTSNLEILMRFRTPAPLWSLAGASLIATLTPPAWSQARNQEVKPPVSQAWIDVATFSGLGMPAGMAGMAGGGGANPMAALGSLFGGGGAQQNHFGQTQGMSPGRWVDVTLYTRNNPQLNDAQMSVPAGFLNPALRLQGPKETRGTTPPEPGDERTTEPEYEKPKGRLLMYWGCSDTIRPGQPKVIDFSNVSTADMAKFFQSRRATQRGTHSAVGRPIWPSQPDARMVPDGASLVGEHGFTGQGVPENFKFQLQAAQDLMPALALNQQDNAGGIQLRWEALPTARAYFLSAMGARERDEMVIWSSSELPDTGFGLMDYQTNPAIDRWLKEQVLLSPKTTQCAVPKGVFNPGGGGMLRMIAYGSELNLAHPPRPTDPKIAWEPQWAAKVRVKSVTMAMLGMEASDGGQRDRRRPQTGQPTPEADAPKDTPKKPGAIDLLKGILGR